MKLFKKVLASLFCTYMLIGSPVSAMQKTGSKSTMTKPSFASRLGGALVNNGLKATKYAAIAAFTIAAIDCAMSGVCPGIHSKVDASLLTWLTKNAVVPTSKFMASLALRGLGGTFKTLANLSVGWNRLTPFEKSCYTVLASLTTATTAHLMTTKKS